MKTFERRKICQITDFWADSYMLPSIKHIRSSQCVTNVVMIPVSRLPSCLVALWRFFLTVCSSDRSDGGVNGSTSTSSERVIIQSGQLFSAISPRMILWFNSVCYCISVLATHTALSTTVWYWRLSCHRILGKITTWNICSFFATCECTLSQPDLRDDVEWQLYLPRPRNVKNLIIVRWYEEKQHGGRAKTSSPCRSTEHLLPAGLCSASANTGIWQTHTHIHTHRHAHACMCTQSLFLVQGCWNLAGGS